MLYRAQKHPPKIRTLAALEAIKELIDKSIEENKPVIFSTGVGKLSGEDITQSMAALTLLNYTAKLAADKGSYLIYLTTEPVIVPIAEDMMRSAYGTQFQNDQIIFLPGQAAMMSQVYGIYERERPSASMLLGALYWEANVITEAAARAGAMQIGGTGRLYQIPYIACNCDFSLIGEELLVAGAYVSQDVPQLGTIQGSDIIRVIIIGLIIIIALTSIVGLNIVTIFKW